MTERLVSNSFTLRGERTSEQKRRESASFMSLDDIVTTGNMPTQQALTVLASLEDVVDEDVTVKDTHEVTNSEGAAAQSSPTEIPGTLRSALTSKEDVKRVSFTSVAPATSLAEEGAEVAPQHVIAVKGLRGSRRKASIAAPSADAVDKSLLSYSNSRRSSVAFSAEMDEDMAEVDRVRTDTLPLSDISDPPAVRTRTRLGPPSTASSSALTRATAWNLPPRRAARLERSTRTVRAWPTPSVT